MLPKNIDTLIATKSPELRNVDKGELAIYLLAQLTPGGSEFYNDPVYCFEWVKSHQDDLHKRYLKAVKENGVYRRANRPLK